MTPRAEDGIIVIECRPVLRGGDRAMDQTTVSSKYQVVIPKSVRRQLELRPGQKLSVVVKGGIISLVPLPSLKELRGFVPGINTHDVREETDRL